MESLPKMRSARKKVGIGGCVETLSVLRGWGGGMISTVGVLPRGGDDIPTVMASTGEAMYSRCCSDGTRLQSQRKEASLPTGPSSQTET